MCVSRAGSPATVVTDEHRAYEVVAFEQVGGRALEADFSVLEEVRAVGDAEREVERLLDHQDRRTRRRATPAGARRRSRQPRARARGVNSSTSSTRGRATSAIVSVSSCCSPPERLPACSRIRAASAGNRSSASRMSSSAAPRSRTSQRASRRCSATRERREHSFAARCVPDPARRDPLGCRVGDVAAFDGDGAVARSHQARHRAQQRSTCRSRSCRAARRSRPGRRRGRRRRAPGRRRTRRRARAPRSRPRAPRRTGCVRSPAARGRPGVRRRPGGEAASTRHEPEEHVPQVGERGAQPAGKHEQHDEEARARCEDLPVDRERPRDAAHVERTEQRAGDGTEAADDDHREHHEALRRGVGVELETVLVVDEQRTRERGEEARDRERDQRAAARVHAVRARGPFVLARRDQHAAGP